MLKWFLWKYKLNIKRFDASFRKTFGRYVCVREPGHASDALSDSARYSTTKEHRKPHARYIGLDQDDIDSFESLSFDGGINYRNCQPTSQLRDYSLIPLNNNYIKLIRYGR